MLFEKIDQLPHGPKWECELFTTEGDVIDPATGKKSCQTLELWKRNPVECIQELLGNPAFRDHIRYAPERLYEDHEGTKPIISEMWTADWWEEIQVRTIDLEVS
jgi:hypothetical protein